MVMSFQGLGDRGKGDLLLIRARQQTKQVSRNEVEVRDSRQRGTACRLWSFGGLFRRFQMVTKHSPSSLNEPHRLNWAGNSAKRAGTGTAAPKPDSSELVKEPPAKLGRPHTLDLSVSHAMMVCRKNGIT